MHKIRAHNKKTSKYLAHNAAECDQSAGEKNNKKLNDMARPLSGTCSISPPRLSTHLPPTFPASNAPQQFNNSP